MKLKLQPLSLAILSLSLTEKVLAADPPPPSAAAINMPASLAQTDRVKVNGWDNYLNLGVTGNLTDNKKVVGKTEGQATTFGTKIEGAIDFKEQEQEWLNSINLLLSYNRTPQLGRYTKSDDTFEAESLYKYYLGASSGAFTRLNIDTALLAGYDERDVDTTYIVRKSGGGTQVVTTDRLKLTQGLRPFRIRESVGVFTNLVDIPLFKIDIKGGVGMRQVVADHQRVLDDDSLTPEVEVKTLTNTQKAGYEIGSEFGGATEDKRISYKISANALFPFYESPDDDDVTGKNTYEKRVLDLSGKLSFKVAEWASLDYTYKMVRDPSILPDAQVTQSFLFSLNQVLAARNTGT